MINFNGYISPTSNVLQSYNTNSSMPVRIGGEINFDLNNLPAIISSATSLFSALLQGISNSNGGNSFGVPANNNTSFGNNQAGGNTAGDPNCDVPGFQGNGSGRPGNPANVFFGNNQAPGTTYININSNTAQPNFNSQAPSLQANISQTNNFYSVQNIQNNPGQWMPQQVQFPQIQRPQVQFPQVQQPQVQFPQVQPQIQLPQVQRPQAQPAQQPQPATQQQKPAGQGLLAQLLGPIGGLSSNLFGNIPIIGDILKITSPIALDLNGNGAIDVTGESTAKNAQRSGLGNTVQMDLNADGTKENTEWLQGTGDAMLVDNRDGKAVEQGIDGTRLFGDEGGKFNNGYEKLARLDSNSDGKLTGAELNGLQAWIDNGDGVAQDSEMVDVAKLGMTSMDVTMNTQKDARGDDLMRSGATINGKSVMTEDVWFGSN